MNYTPEQIAEIVLKVLKEVNDETPDVSKLSTEEKNNLAKDPNATVEILQVLAQDKNYYVRYGVSKHPNATVEILQVLAQDEDWGVRSGVSQHPNATVEILQVLAQDEDSYVRSGVSQHPNYKSKTLELTSAQYEALKSLLKSSQDEILKSVSL